MNEKKTKKKIKSQPEEVTFGSEGKSEDEETSSGIFIPDETDDLSEPVTQFGFLVRDLRSIDVEKTYNLLKSKIKLGKDRLDVDVLSEAVDEAPEWAYKAAQLYILAKVEKDKFEDIVFKLRYAELADEASSALEMQKKAGRISGQITKEKIENWIILNRPEYKRLLQQMSELKIAEEAFKSLSSQFESKKSLLQTQGRLSEKKKIILINE